MSTWQKPTPSTERVARWLADYHNATVSDLKPLSGGFWSSAFAYRVGAEEYVVRLGDSDEGFVIDAAAMRFTAPELPVPEVVAIGEALGLFFAISKRHRGRFIEAGGENEAYAVGAALADLLQALRAAPVQADDPVVWYAPEASEGVTWRSWLRAGLVDDPSSRSSGWRAKLARNDRIDALFTASEERIDELLPLCPERRDLVHGDLLHQNVLIAAEPARVSAVFSWKCSARGDFLYDVAWCTFWSAWHVCIDGADLWRRTLEAEDLGDEDLADAGSRHHCYELQIAASHLGWNAWVNDDDELHRVADAIEGLLAKGPLI